MAFLLELLLRLLGGASAASKQPSIPVTGIRKWWKLRAAQQYLRLSVYNSFLLVFLLCIHGHEQVLQVIVVKEV